VASDSSTEVMMPEPPACQASVVGGIETSTAAIPPSAAKPIRPTLNRPA